MKSLYLLLLLVLAPMSSQAHKPSDAYWTVQIADQRITQRLDIALRDLDLELALDSNDDGQLSWGEVRSKWAQIAALADAGAVLRAMDTQCHAQPMGQAQLDEHSDGGYAVLTRVLDCDAPVTQLSMHYSLFAASDPTHRGIVRIVRAGATQTAVLGPSHPTLQLGAARTLPVFIAEGVHHILIGWDHVLFLLALLLPAVLVRRSISAHSTVDNGPASKFEWQGAPALRPVFWHTLGIVSAFTLAHSITLALAVFDVFNPPSRWVESIIAASVVVAALNNLYPLVGRQRWLVTFGFGLVHGFGFAGVLKDLGLAQGSLWWPVLSFNLGVELGQAAIVALFLTLAWSVRTTRWYRIGVLQGGSVLIALVAMVWLAERALDLRFFA